MSRSTIRVLVIAVLALLGAPVAIHVVIHDLHGHGHAHEHETGYTQTHHGDHEHPIVSSSAPQVPSVTRAAFAVPSVPPVLPKAWTNIVRAERNVLKFGALRTDTDVGLQPLLATFLI